MSVPDPRRIAVICFVLMLAVFGLFAARPDLDIQVAGLFYHDAAFPAERVIWLETFRNGLWNTAIAAFVLSLIGSVVAVVKRRAVLAIPARVWWFFLAVFLAAPAALVNGVLKSHWGRARPFQIDLFGGEALFTPFWKVADQCARNCSFVSGEVSGATALAVMLIVAAWHLRARIGGAVVGAVWTIAALLPVLSSLQRMAAGRHFLSDCMMAMLLTVFLAALLYRPIVARRGAAAI